MTAILVSLCSGCTGLQWLSEVYLPRSCLLSKWHICWQKESGTLIPNCETNAYLERSSWNVWSNTVETVNVFGRKLILQSLQHRVPLGTVSKAAVGLHMTCHASASHHAPSYPPPHGWPSSSSSKCSGEQRACRASPSV